MFNLFGFRSWVLGFGVLGLGGFRVLRFRALGFRVFDKRQVYTCFTGSLNGLDFTTPNT